MWVACEWEIVKIRVVLLGVEGVCTREAQRTIEKIEAGKIHPIE